MGLLQAVREASGRALGLSIEVVLPRTCAGCDISGTWMCASCAAELKRIDAVTACRRCGHPASHGPRVCGRCRNWPPELTVVRASFEFDGHVRAAIHRVKYRGESARAAWCATEMTTLLSPSPDRPDAICAVPLAPNRRRRRGFNQSEVVGRALAKQVGLSYLDALERVRDTAPQVGLTAEERYLNVQNAFRAVTSLEGIHLGLVDDVLTTGATMRACAQAARQAGAARVTGLVLATDVWTGSAT